MSTGQRAVLALLTLTFATGVVDAISYVALDKVFTGNMTGNVLLIGFSVGGVEEIPLVNNLVALGGFVLGSIIAGRVVPRAKVAVLPRPALSALIGCAVLIALVAVTWVIIGTENPAVELVMTGTLAVAMGAQVNAVKPLGNTDISTIVVTNTLANLARDSKLGGGGGQAWGQRLSAALCLGSGAATGVFILDWLGGAAAVTLAAVLIAAVVVVLWRAPRED
ncbi:MAG: YoaK family protein [Mycetocola sp.]